MDLYGKLVRNSLHIDDALVKHGLYQLCPELRTEYPWLCQLHTESARQKADVDVPLAIAAALVGLADP